MVRRIKASLKGSGNIFDGIGLYGDGSDGIASVTGIRGHGVVSRVSDPAGSGEL